MWLCLELHVLFICRKFYKEGNVDVSQQITAQKACFCFFLLHFLCGRTRQGLDYRLIIETIYRFKSYNVVELKPLRCV